MRTTHARIAVVILSAIRLTVPLFFLFPFSAAQAQEEKVTIRPEPLVETPLRDPAIVRDPETDTFYLTGTAASTRGIESGQLDFDNNDGLYLWRSTDRKTWEALGKVFSLDEGQDQGNERRWTQYFRLNPDNPEGPWVRGIQSPELVRAKGNWFVAFGMSGGGTGLLKSTSGTAEGPYAMHARLTTLGQTPSLFVDGDGAAYWLWDGGWIAPLNDDLTALSAKPVLLQCPPESALGDEPRTVGRRGAFLFRHGQNYHLVAEDWTSRLGAACRDTFVASAESVYGPYSERRLMIPHGGQVTLFHDAENRPHSTFGGDAEAVFRDRAGIVPLVDDGFLKHLSIVRPFRTGGSVVYDVEPIFLPYGTRAQDQEHDGFIRDPQILTASDGFYYLTGTTSRTGLRVPGLRVWRSDDLATWTPMGDADGVLWFVDQTEWTSRPFRSQFVPQPVHDFWAPEIHEVHGDFYIPFCMFGGGSGMLKSTSGKPEGPYEDWTGRLHTWAGDPSLFVDDDGAVYMLLGFGPMQIAKMTADMRGFEWGPKPIGPADGSVLGHEGGYLVKMEGKYVLFYTTLNGEEEPLRKERKAFHRISTYDFVYCFSDALMGPYTSVRVAVPHGGHGAVFQDRTGRWLATMFGTDTTAPFRGRLGLLELDVRMEAGELRISPKTPVNPPDKK